MTTQEEIRLWKEDMKIDMILFRTSGKSLRLFNQFVRELTELQADRLDWLENTATMSHLAQARQELKRQGFHTQRFLEALILS